MSPTTRVWVLAGSLLRKTRSYTGEAHSPAQGEKRPGVGQPIVRRAIKKGRMDMKEIHSAIAPLSVRTVVVWVANWVPPIAFSALTIRFLVEAFRQGFSWLATIQIVAAGFVALILWLNVAFGWWCRGASPRPGHCPKCEYDLTANTSGICPECGRPVDRHRGRGGESSSGRSLPGPEG